MLSLADTNHYYQLYLSQGLAQGIGGGLLYVPALAIQAHHWKERRALAMGIVITGACKSLSFEDHLPYSSRRIFRGRDSLSYHVESIN